LFLISFDKFNDQYRLIKLLDMADFPSELGKNLQPLLDEKLICVSGLSVNGTPFKYGLTEKGKVVCAESNLRTEILDYIRTMQNPTLLLEITESLIAKERGRS
jgi:hypothetical protein